MKINKKRNFLIVILTTFAIFTIFQSCTTVEKPPIKIDPKVLSCCPNGGGLLDSLINNPVDSTNEYAPYVVYGANEDVLWFTTSREKEFKNKKLTFYPGELMYSTRPKTSRNKCPNQGWSKAERFATSDEKFEKWTRGSVAFYDDKMIIAAESSLDNLKPSESFGVSYNLDLWELKNTGVSPTSYDNPMPITTVNSIYWESQPCVSPDGKTLFFVSNRPRPDFANASDKNIWYSIRKGDNWGDPKPLNSINTRGDEVSPHWGADGKFYFSSNWSRVNDTLSATKFDIFVCETFLSSDGVVLPTDPINVNSLSRKSMCGPESQMNINTPANEMFPYITPDKKAIYWASDVKGGYGKLDIYGCGLPDPCLKLVVTVRERLIDTSGGKHLIISNGYEVVPNHPLKLVGGTTKNFFSDAEEKLEAGKKYQVLYDQRTKDCYDGNCSPKILEFETFINDTIIRDTIDCDFYKRTRETVTLAGGHIPFFVTGYWWPSTSENISELNRRRNAKTLDTTFIDPKDYDYFSTGTTNSIDKFFENNIYSKLEKIANDLSKCGGDDIVAISVRGYTDECRLMPGKYTVDESITVGDIHIPQGWSMRSTSALNTSGKRVNLFEEGQQGNIILSKLRAYYTHKTIDNAMRKRSDAFRKLADKGQIKYDYEGYGIYDRNRPCQNDSFEIAGSELSKDASLNEKCNHPMSRRISIYFELIPKTANEVYKLTRCGTPEDEYEAWLTRNTEKSPQTDENETANKPVDSKKPDVPEGATGCTGPNCYVIAYGIVNTQEEFDTIKDFLSKLSIEVFSEKLEDGKIRIISSRLTEENANQTLMNYSNSVENFIRSIVKKIEFKAEIIKIGS